jgi:hypothetical protein
MYNEELMAHSIWLGGAEKIKIKLNRNSCLAVGIEIDICITQRRFISKLTAT